jgi:hypothetical protein
MLPSRLILRDGSSLSIADVNNEREEDSERSLAGSARWSDFITVGLEVLAKNRREGIARLKYLFCEKTCSLHLANVETDP